MYKEFYGLSFNPFGKEIPVDKLFITKDLKQFESRMSYFTQVKGFSVTFGRTGMGKTSCIRYFTSQLNPQLFKVVYIPLSSVTVTEFYSNLCVGLGLIPKRRKADMFHQLQDHIINLCHTKKQTPFFILDECQFISTPILHELRMLFSFQMDSKNYTMVLLSGQSSFLNQLNLHVHEPLRQRIIVHHECTGLKEDEVADYVTTLLEHASLRNPLFTEDAFEAITSASSGSPRMIGHLAEKSMMIGAQRKLSKLDSTVVQDAFEAIKIHEKVR